jgi:hypothetical protein
VEFTLEGGSVSGAVNQSSKSYSLFHNADSYVERG